VRPARKRELAAKVCDEWGVSIRRACSVLEFDRSTYHYKSRRREQAGIDTRIKEICQTRVRYGYRRVHVLLRREGWEINIKKTHRIYSALGLQLRKKPPKRRVKAKLRDDRRAASTSNEVWAMDFVHDQLATGQKIRILTVVDTFSRFSPVVDPSSVTGPKMSRRRLNEPARLLAIPRRSGSTRARSSSRATSIYGPMRKTSRWTSRDPASPRTTPSSRHSTGAYAPSALMLIGS
jgi:HTH-like domain